MTSSEDPFEQAARREQADRLHREARIASVRDGIAGEGSRGMRDRDCGVPRPVSALVRAARREPCLVNPNRR